MARAIEREGKLTKSLVQITYGDPGAPSFLRYTDWAAGFIDTGPVTYDGKPDMEVVLPSNVMGFDAKSAIVVLPQVDVNLSTTFPADISSGEPAAPVFVKIRELVLEAIPGYPSPTASSDDLVHFEGRLVKATRNYKSRAGVVGLEFLPTRARLDLPLGLVCGDQCAWPFGEPRTCKIDTAPLKNAATVANVAVGIDLTINGATVPGSSPQRDNYYRGGYVERNGLRILIRDWIYTSPTIFRLSQKPPAEWQNHVVTLTPGCDKSRASCRDRWSNEVNFGGFGFAMPSYDPNLDAPG